MKLPEINFKIIPQYSTSLIVGKRGSGKTKLIVEHVKHICKHRSINNIYIFDETLKYNNMYTDLDKNKIVTFFKLTNQTYESMTDHLDATNSLTESILIVDNICHTAYNEMCFMDIAQNTKKLTIFVGEQYLLGQRHSQLISNCNFIFLAREVSLVHKRHYYNKLFRRAYPSFGKFKKDFDENTKKFNFFVLNKQNNNVCSHNSSYLLTINNIVVTITELDELLDMVDWLNNDTINDIYLPKQMKSDAREYKHMYIEI
jgi:energy-coupling factor transporter ATP-binding protein EcfA2